MSFITKEEASVEFQRLVNLQSLVFLTLQQETRTPIDGLANQADVALKEDRAEFLSELGTLREHRMRSVRTMRRWTRCKRSSTATTLPSRGRLGM